MRARRRTRWAIVAGYLVLPLGLIGCATVQHQPFQQFSTSVQELRDGANAALQSNEEENRERFVTATAEALADPDAGGEAAANLQIQPVEDDVFGWDMDEVPLFVVSGRFRQGVDRLNTALVTYSGLLEQLASPELLSRDQFDTMARDLNANVASATGALQVETDPRRLSLFSAASTGAFQAYLENRRRDSLRAAIETNQVQIDAIAAHLRSAAANAARNLRANYLHDSQEMARTLAAAGGESLTARKRMIEEHLALNERYLSRLAALETLDRAYGALSGAHKELARAVDDPAFGMSSVRELFDQGKHLLNLRKELAGSAAPAAGDGGEER